MATYRVLVVGDIHLGKKFKSYKTNPYSKVKVPLTELWTSETINYLATVVEKISGSLGVDEVILLGDIVDSPRVEPEVANLAKKMIDFFKEISPKVSIVVGNHDTAMPQEDSATILSIFRDKQVSVYTRATLDEEKGFLYLPYYEKDKLPGVLSQVRKYGPKFAFSHNDIYVNDVFINTDMMSVEELQELLGGLEVVTLMDISITTMQSHLKG